MNVAARWFFNIYPAPCHIFTKPVSFFLINLVPGYHFHTNL